MQKNVHAKSNKVPIKCILEENKICDNCCECFVCDLDPDKICDNCAKCLEITDFKAILIDDILMLEETEDKKKKNKSTKKPTNR